MVLPADPDYDEARAIWNSMRDRRPALLVQTAGVEDVRMALGFGLEHGLPIAVRAGAHNVGQRDRYDGLVMDLSGMETAHVDQDARIVRVQGGDPFERARMA